MTMPWSDSDLEGFPVRNGGELRKGWDTWQRFYSTKLTSSERRAMEHGNLEALKKVRNYIERMRAAGVAAAEIRAFEAGFLGEVARLHFIEGTPIYGSWQSIARYAFGWDLEADNFCHRIDRRLEQAVRLGAPEHVADRSLLVSLEDFLDKPTIKKSTSGESKTPEAVSMDDEAIDFKMLILLLEKQGLLSLREALNTINEVIDERKLGA